MISRLILVVLLVTGAVATAQESPAVLTVNGHGNVPVRPDMATILLGVETQAPTADRALRLNAVRMQQIFDVLLAAGIERKDIQTSQLTLFPQRSSDSRSGNQPLKVTGFLTTNLVKVIVRDLDLLGRTLDALTKSGANRIQNINLGIAMPEPHRDVARAMAVKDAMRKAGLYTRAAGLRLGRILAITEGGAAAAPEFRAQALALDVLPIAEGELAITADVTIQFSLVSP